MDGRKVQGIIIAILAFIAVTSTVLVFKLRAEMKDMNNSAVTKEEAVCAPAAPTAPVVTNERGALAVIHSRTSVRSYQQRAVDPGFVEAMVKAGMAAPTAGNKQPWYFVTTTDKAVLKKLAEANEHGSMLAGAGAAIVVVGAPSEGLRGEAGEMWVQDCSAATENILLAAEAMGIGAVWIGVYPVAERVAAVRAALGIPEGYVPLSIVSAGWPDTRPEPKDKFKPEKVYSDLWGKACEFGKGQPTPPAQAPGAAQGMVPGAQPQPGSSTMPTDLPPTPKAPAPGGVLPGMFTPPVPPPGQAAAPFVPPAAGNAPATVQPIVPPPEPPKPAPVPPAAVPPAIE